MARDIRREIYRRESVAQGNKELSSICERILKEKPADADTNYDRFGMHPHTRVDYGAIELELDACRKLSPERVDSLTEKEFLDAEAVNYYMTHD